MPGREWLKRLIEKPEADSMACRQHWVGKNVERLTPSKVEAYLHGNVKWKKGGLRRWGDSESCL